MLFFLGYVHFLPIPIPLVACDPVNVKSLFVYPTTENVVDHTLAGACGVLFKVCLYLWVITIEPQEQIIIITH